MAHISLATLNRCVRHAYLFALRFRQKAVFLRLGILTCIAHKTPKDFLKLMVDINSAAFAALRVLGGIKKDSYGALVISPKSARTVIIDSPGS